LTVAFRPNAVMVLGSASLEITTQGYIGPELALLSEASLWSFGPVISHWFPGAVLTNAAVLRRLPSSGASSQPRLNEFSKGKIDNTVLRYEISVRSGALAYDPHLKHLANFAH
jgi:hypothetical protein